MEINLTVKQVQDLIHGIEVSPRCVNGSCDRCKLLVTLTKTPQIKSLVETAINNANSDGNMAHFVTLVNMGFIMGWTYRESASLEELFKV